MNGRLALLAAAATLGSAALSLGSAAIGVSAARLQLRTAALGVEAARPRRAEPCRAPQPADGRALPPLMELMP